MRALRIVGIALLALVAITAIAVWWLIATESGARFAAERSRAFLPEGVTFARVEGRLIERLAVHDVSVATPDADVTIERVTLSWSPWSLRGRELVIHELTVAGVVVDVREGEPPAEPPATDPVHLPARIELPITAAVERLALEGAVLHLHGTDADGNAVTTEIVLDSLSLAATWDDATLNLADLTLRSPLLDLDAALTVDAHGAYAVDAALAWTLRLAALAEGSELPTLSGETTLSGSLADLTLQQTLTEPFAIRADVTAAGLVVETDAPEGARFADVDTLALQGRLQVQDVDPRAVDPQALAEVPGMRLDVDIALSGTPANLELQAAIAARTEEFGDVQLTLDAVWSGTTLALQSLELTQPGRPAAVQATGEVQLAADQDIAAQLDLAWQSLQWPLDGEAIAASPEGTLGFSGTLNDYEFDVESELVMPDQPQLNARFTGRGSLQAAQADLTLRAGDGELDGTLDVSWDPAVAWRVELTGSRLDPGLFLPDWPGRFDLVLAAEGRLDDNSLVARIERFEADGELQGQPLRVNTRLDYSQPLGDDADTFVFRLDVADLDIEAANIRLTASGRVDDSADLSWQLDAPELARLAEGVSGSLSGEGRVTGAIDAPRITATLRADDAGYEDYRIASLALDADIDLSGRLRSQLALQAQDAQIGEIVVAALTLNVDGTPEAHDVRVALQSSEGDVDVALSGQLSGALFAAVPAQPADALTGAGDDDLSWRFQLSEARLAHPELAAWTLTEPAHGFVAADAFSVQRHCWASDEAGLCLEGVQEGGVLELALALTDLPFDYFTAIMPPEPRLTGTMSLDGSLRYVEGGPVTGELHLTTSAGEVSVPVSEDEATFDGFVVQEDGSGVATDLQDGVLWNRLRFEPGDIRLTLNAADASLTAHLPVEYGHLRLGADFNAADGEDLFADWPGSALAGSLEIDVPDLAFVGAFITDLRDVAGSLRGQLMFDGTVGNPMLTGNIRMQDGRAMVPLAGITVSELNGTISGQRDGVELSASAQSGDGTVNISGSVNLLTEQPEASLRVQGDSFLLVNTPDARIFVSPDLTIAATMERVDVTGDVRVPRAAITPVTPPSTAVAVSSDEVLLTGEEDELEAPLTEQAFHARVRLVLGDNVTFDGYGLTARLRGNVEASQSPGTPLTGTGEINLIDGEYRAYGQGLVIETGNIYFAGGPITEPALDIRAVRRPRAGIVVGAHVVGTLEEPTFTLFSEPPMSELEQLSYLVLGRSLQEAPTGETNALSQAALAMGLRGGDFLARNIGERIGVDQFGIETGTGEAGAESDPMQAALVVGKYLSPRLYVSYGIGLFDPINVLRIQYTISDRWRIVTQSSSEATGADIVYAVERGR